MHELTRLMLTTPTPRAARPPARASCPRARSAPPRRASPRTVSSSGRNVRPAAIARDESASSKPAISAPTTQSGSSIHSPTSCSSEELVVDPDEPRVGVDARARRLEHSLHRERAASTALNVPPVPLLGRGRRATRRGRARRSAAPALSRGPGARTSPPRAIRCGQYVKRPVGSCGPTISPGLTIADASPYVRCDDALALRLQRRRRTRATR